jgi:hypothetical protein
MLLTVSEVAERLRLRESCVYRLCRVRGARSEAAWSAWRLSGVRMGKRDIRRFIYVKQHRAKQHADEKMASEIPPTGPRAWPPGRL